MEVEDVKVIEHKVFNIFHLSLHNYDNKASWKIKEKEKNDPCSHHPHKTIGIDLYRICIESPVPAREELGILVKGHKSYTVEVVAKRGETTCNQVLNRTFPKERKRSL